MAAVTANQVVAKQDGCRGALPVAASTHIHEGTMIYENLSGYATDDDGAGLFPFAGIAILECDNTSGSAGDKTVEFWKEGDFLLIGSGFSQASVGLPVFGIDNFTVQLGNTLASYVGEIVYYVSSTKVRVKIRSTRGMTRLATALNNVNDTTPTAAELTTSFGAPASLGAGFVGVVNDNAGGTNFYIVATDGTSFFFLKMTKAT